MFFVILVDVVVMVVLIVRVVGGGDVFGLCSIVVLGVVIIVRALVLVLLN